MVDGCPYRLLLINSHQGTLKLSIRSESQSVLITIQDTSEGMTDDVLQELFELNFAKQGNRVSMGLELPTAKLVVNQHGGNLHAESEVGKGTRFIIHLPYENMT